jgi:lysophospholipase L1-like esterase
MKTVLCYGDSNTHGTKPIDFDPIETQFIPCHYRYPREKRWTYILQEGLGSNYYVVEEGLNGRTTVFDDPVEGLHKNGLKYLLPCLESHAPVDLVIIMLGTNDLKPRFCASAYDIALSAGVLASTVKNSNFGPEGKNPEVLLLCPPPLGRQSFLKGFFGIDEIEKSLLLSKYYKKVAGLYRCSFFDVSEIIKPSDIDGAHYDEKDVKKLGKHLVGIVRSILD